MRTFSFALDIQLQTRWGLVVGAGPGGRSFGFSFGAYLAYHLPLSAHWALRPGVRANRLWWKTDNCAPTCTHDFLIVETAIRYRGASGFVFECGWPLFGWIPVGPGAGETRSHLELFDIASAPDLAIASSVLVGYAFDF